MVITVAPPEAAPAPVLVIPSVGTCTLVLWGVVLLKNPLAVEARPPNPPLTEAAVAVDHDGGGGGGGDGGDGGGGPVAPAGIPVPAGANPNGGAPAPKLAPHSGAVAVAVAVAVAGSRPGLPPYGAGAPGATAGSHRNKS